MIILKIEFEQLKFQSNNISIYLNLMTMIKSIFLIALFLFGITAMAQTNFSGNWELSKTKSKLNAEFSMAPVKLVINQDSKNLKVERHSNFQGNSFTSESNYTLDGLECINSGWEDMKIKSVTLWDEAQKILIIKSKIPMQDGSEMSISENYQITDGNLSIISKASSSWGDMEETWVFEKK